MLPFAEFHRMISVRVSRSWTSRSKTLLSQTAVGRSFPERYLETWSVPLFSLLPFSYPVPLTSTSTPTDLPPPSLPRPFPHLRLLRQRPHNSQERKQLHSGCRECDSSSRGRRLGVVGGVGGVWEGAGRGAVPFLPSSSLLSRFVSEAD